MLTKKALLLAKIESSYGVDPTPTAANDSVLVYNPVVNVIPEKLSKNDAVRPNLTKFPHTIGSKYVEITFQTRLKGSGTAGTPPEIDPLLRACGFGVTNVPATSDTYAPVSISFESCAVYVYLDGIIHKVLGCRGSFEVTSVTGQQATISWRFEGLYQVPVDGAIVSGAVFDSTQAPAVINGTFSYGGDALYVKNVSLNMNVSLARKEDVNSTQGVAEIEIVDKDPSGSMDPITETEATHAFWGNWSSGNGATLSLVIGSTAGNIITIGSDTNGCVKDAINHGDRDGLRAYSIPFGLYGDGGDDEISIAFT